MRTAMTAPLRTLVLSCLAVLLLGAALGADPAAAACGPGSKKAFAKVELWPNADCTGGSVILGKNGDDVPNFEQFPNYDGRVLDANNSRSSMAIASGWCVRLFQDKNYGGDSSTVFCATGTGPSTYRIKNLNDLVSSMRVCGNGERGQCNKVPSAVAPPDVTETPDTDPGAPTTPPPAQPGDPDPFAGDPGEGGAGGGAAPGGDTTVPPGGDTTVPPGGDTTVPGGDDTFPGETGAAGGATPLGPNDGLRFDRAGKRCTKGSTAGARALRTWLGEASVPQRRTADIYRCARKGKDGRRDLHSEGRAVDVQIVNRAAAEGLIELLLADDYDLARRMGVQEIIYNGTVWSAANPSKLLRRYRGKSPHRRSVHIGLNRAGAAMRTSFWAGR